ncbi:MAG TPA: hypothetical protein VFT67_17050 [Jatrophihabitantaceae bacterium]|jgi:hypothetical protein|nr:hypothetical protein [Jatrophihabitantaceae bacterium]
MRWDAMFADLEAQAEALEVAERAGEVDERVRAEFGALTLFDRLRPAIASPVRLRTAGAGVLAGTITRAGPDWVLLDQDNGREVLVRLGAVTGISGLGRLTATPDSLDPVTARLGLWFVLRRIARDRSPVTVRLVDGSTVHATVDRVGADFVEAAVHAPGELRRPRSVREELLIPMAALVSVHREA